MSINRLMNASTQPPKKPAMIPAVVPSSTDNMVAKNAISSEIRDPYTTRLNRSRPFTGSTPNRWSQLTPPHLPIGPSVPVWVSIRSWWNSFGGSRTPSRSAREDRHQDQQDDHDAAGDRDLVPLPAASRSDRGTCPRSCRRPPESRPAARWQHRARLLMALSRVGVPCLVWRSCGAQRDVLPPKLGAQHAPQSNTGKVRCPIVMREKSCRVRAEDPTDLGSAPCVAADSRRVDGVSALRLR